jgi:hypothetical protein
MPHITGKASHHYKKGLNFSGNALKKIKIFASISLKISLKCHEFLKTKKPRILKKKASWQLLHCHNGQSAPAV